MSTSFSMCYKFKYSRTVYIRVNQNDFVEGPYFYFVNNAHNLSLGSLWHKLQILYHYSLHLNLICSVAIPEIQLEAFKSFNFANILDTLTSHYLLNKPSTSKSHLL